MTEDQALALTATLAMMALVFGSLLVRRMPMRMFGRLALVWLAIFAAAFLIGRLFPLMVAHFT
jgi:hypothetical protein